MIPHLDLAWIAVPLALNLLALGSLVAIGLAAAMWISRTAPARARYLVAAVAFAAAALLPVAATLRRADAGGASLAASLGLDRVGGGGAWFSKPLSVAPPAAAGERQRAPADLLAGRVRATADRLAESRLGSVLAGVWVFVAIALLGRDAAGYVLLARSRRAWTPAPEPLRMRLQWPDRVPLYVHESDGPCTVGLWRPAVVLSLRVVGGLSAEDSACVARHELGHARWRDPLVNLVVRGLRAALWPGLPLWLIESRLRIEREAAADREAIDVSRRSAEAEAIVAYAAALVSVARWSSDRGGGASTATRIGGDARVEERVRRLLACASSPSPARAAAAAAILAATMLIAVALPVASRTGDPAAALERQRSGIERRTIEALERAGVTRADASARAGQATASTIALVGSLHARDWRLAGDTSAALDRIRSSGTVEPLVAALQDGDRRVRERAAWAIGQLRDRRAVDALLPALTDEAAEVRHTAAWALGMIGDRRAVEPLVVNLSDEHFEARHAAAWALGQIGDPRAVPGLVARLKDESPDVRHGAAWALAKTGDDRSVAALNAARGDPDPDVRDEVQRALSGFAGP
jgi:HEAT repeat protein